VSRAGAGYRDAHVIHAVGLGCRVEQADQLVYADQVNLKHAVPVGATCRLCPRADCAHRAMPRLTDPQEVHEGVRGVSFYGPAR
jgi:predicted transcriptional regulator